MQPIMQAIASNIIIVIIVNNIIIAPMGKA